MIITALIALAATSGGNEMNTRGLVIPQPVRYEYVHEVASKTCPRVATFVPSVEKMVAFMTDVSERLGLNPDERILLADFCMVYAQGLGEQ